jgi:hypothetical protein
MLNGPLNLGWIFLGRLARTRVDVGFESLEYLRFSPVHNLCSRKIVVYIVTLTMDLPLRSA